VPVAGVACTAALVTDRARRGADRAWIALASDAGPQAFEVVLAKAAPSPGGRERAAQDRAVADHLLRAIARTAGVCV
jgi:hypothetical protein